MIYEAQITGRYNGQYWVTIPVKYGRQAFGPIRAVPGIDPVLDEYVYVGQVPAAETYVILSGTPIPTATIAWANITGKPTTFTPSSHSHAAADTTSGVFAAARLPAATTSAQGAMSASDKAKLDGASSVAGPNTILRANSVGDIAVNTPTSSVHAANKGYVDTQIATRAPSSHTHAWADITGAPSTYTPSAHVHAAADTTSGIFATARIPVGTTSAPGSMSAADKTKLDAATQANTPGAIVSRDGNGDFTARQVVLANPVPTATSHATRKDYVDAQVATRLPINGELGATHLDTVNTLGIHFTSAGANVTTANGYPTDGGAGGLLVRPFHGSNPASWVIQEWTQWAPFRQWGRSSNNAINALGWTAWKEITNSAATSSVEGLMSATDKAKLDAATSSPTASTLAMRDSAGALQVLMPASGLNYATNRSYVDTQVATRAPSSHTHLWADTTDKPSTFAPSAHTHPWADVTGKPTTFAPAAHTHLWADLTDKPTTFAPSTHTHTWAQITGAPATYAPSAHVHSGADITTGTISDLRIANASASLDGLMPKADKAKLDAATASNLANTIVLRNATGIFSMGDPTAATHGATKGYVDAQTALRALLSHSHTWADLPAPVELDGTTDYNTFVTTARYHQSANAEAVTAPNSPSSVAGMLDVYNMSSTFVYQFYWEYNSTGKIYYRTKYSTTWYAWKELATTASPVWTTIPITDTTNFEPYETWSTIKIEKSNGWVNLQGSLRQKVAGTVDGTAAVPVGTVPAAFLPASNTTVLNWRCQSSSNNSFGLEILSDGRINVNRYGPGASAVNAWLPFNVSWRI